jgi:hypothetical protein
MDGRGDRPLVGPGSELQLTIDGRAVPHAEVLAALATPGADVIPAPESRSPDADGST